MNVLFIGNRPALRERAPYNALRLAGTHARRDEVSVRVLLLGAAVGGAVAGQRPPDGYYHLDRMLRPVVRKDEVACCGTCMDARAL